MGISDGGTLYRTASDSSSLVFLRSSSLYSSCLVFSCSVRSSSAALRDSSEKFQEVISGPSRACTVSRSGREEGAEDLEPSDEDGAGGLCAIGAAGVVGRARLAGGGKTKGGMVDCRDGEADAEEATDLRGELCSAGSAEELKVEGRSRSGPSVDLEWCLRWREGLDL